MFKQNDILVYGNNGICTLTDIKSEEMFGNTSLYYILTPVYDKLSTIYIPIDNNKPVSSLRHVLAKDELDKILYEAKDKEVLWVSAAKERSEHFKKIVSKGLSVDLLCVMKSIIMQKRSFRNTSRKLTYSDTRTLEKCEKIVGEEYAFVFGVDVKDAVEHIENELIN